MTITITVADAVSASGYGSIVVLADGLEHGDSNFKGRSIAVQRGQLTGVTDSHDDLRAALLMLLVAGTLQHRGLLKSPARNKDAAGVAAHEF